MPPSRSNALAELRRTLAAQGALVDPTPRAGEPTGFSALDAIAGWPSPGLAEVVGQPGTGRMGLVLPLLARHSQAGRWVAIIDVLGRLHPPGLIGVAWPRLLLVRPGAERAVWAAEQLAASGAVAAVVLLDPMPVGRAGFRLLRAAEQGGATVLVLGERREQSLPASLRLEALGHGPGALRVRVHRAPGRHHPDRPLELPASG
jgi:protein ImuA